MLRHPLLSVWLCTLGLMLALAWGGFLPAVQAQDIGANPVTLISNGKSRVVICAPKEVIESTNPEPDRIWMVPTDAAANRARLRESIKDLAATLEKMSGAKVEIIAGLPQDGDKRVPILVGQLGADRFGQPQNPQELKQGFRYVVTPEAIGLIGESDLSTSYAIYELLDRLGCRMYMPGDLGWCVPELKTVRLASVDFSGRPYSVCRQVWYADNNYGRRNRLGGVNLSAGHALEMYIDKKDREKNPQWRATVDGKPHNHRLKWSSPGLAETIADRIIAAADKSPSTLTFSLSPDDGMGYDNSAEDKALDAGDIDQSIQEVSLTDRLVWFCNKIVARVKTKHPNLIFGMLAYTPYSRPPVREKLDPAIIPQIAPITFSRAHPMNDDAEPNNKDLRFIVQGWAKAAPRTSYYFYSWFLAELSGPNPMIKKWSFDVPYVYKNGNCYFWQPETITNFESSFHAYAIGLAVSWNPDVDPAQVVAELNQKFYGKASKEMAAYWDHIDEVWYGVHEFAGCGFGHMRRWTPANMAKARRLLDKARAVSVNPIEAERIEMAHQSLSLFEDFMKMRHYLADGKWEQLDKEASSYRDRMMEMGKKYKANYAFGAVGWARSGSVNNAYFDAFYKATYDDAARISRDARLVLRKPIRNFKYMADPKDTGEKEGWFKADLDDKAWKTTDVCIDTWSFLGLHNYMGTAWYRTTVEVPALQTDRKAMVWIGATDGTAEVWVNGKKAKFVDPKGKATEFVGYCEPASFDVTGLLQPGANQVTIKSTRKFINELGTGGLIAPVQIYQVP